LLTSLATVDLAFSRVVSYPTSLLLHYRCRRANWSRRRNAIWRR